MKSPDRINTAILSELRRQSGIGFAVPINMARHDMDQIVEHGKVERGYLGILPQDVTPAWPKRSTPIKWKARWWVK